MKNQNPLNVENHLFHGLGEPRLNDSRFLLMKIRFAQNEQTQILKIYERKSNYSY